MTTSKPVFIILAETPAESWKRDASTWALALACLVPGWYFDMVILTVLGILVFTYMTMKAVLNLGVEAMTIEEARAKIDEIEKSMKEKEANNVE